MLPMPTSFFTRHTPSSLLAFPHTTFRTLSLTIKLPRKPRLRLLSKHTPNPPRRSPPQIPTLLKNLFTPNPNLRPPKLDKPINTDRENHLPEPSPADSTSTHGTRFAIGIDAELLIRGHGFCGRESVFSVWIGEDGAAVCDCGHFAIEGRVSGRVVVVYARADLGAQIVLVVMDGVVVVFDGWK